MTFEEFARRVDERMAIVQRGDSLRFSNSRGAQFTIDIEDLERALDQLSARHDDVESHIRAHEDFQAGASPWKYRESIYRSVFTKFFDAPQFAALYSLARSQTRGLTSLLSKYVGWRTENARCGPDDDLLFDKASVDKSIAARTAETAVGTASTSGASIEGLFMQICSETKRYNEYDGTWLRNSPDATGIAEALSKVCDWLRPRIRNATGFQFEHAVGAGIYPKVPWIALLPPGQRVNNGRYVAICFDVGGGGAVAGFARSVTTETGLETVTRSRSQSQFDVRKYNAAFVNPRDIAGAPFDERAFLQHIQESVDLARAHTQPQSGVKLDFEAIKECEKAIAGTGLVYPDGLVRRVMLALAAKPFVILTGGSGTGKTRIAESVAFWLCGGDERRVALLPVGADWTDNRNVLGFVNYLRESSAPGTAVPRPVFQSTRALDLLLAASKDESNPYFLILDEMNLSHVERYFADFLSTMESGSAQFQLHSEPDSLPRAAGAAADVPARLVLPRNVFVIGTVNVDETTYMFSPKVLDRAFVIEFRAEPAAVSSFLEARAAMSEALPSCPPEVATSFVRFSNELRGAVPVSDLQWETNRAEAPPSGGVANCVKVISDLFDLMSRARRPFAFRTMREMQLYLEADSALRPNSASWDSDRALDEVVLMKVLPRIHGSRRVVAPLLSALLTYTRALSLEEAAAKLTPHASPRAETQGDGEQTTAKLPRCHQKLSEMLLDLERDQFVSFLG